MGVMDNKVCIITGGAGSIGVASAGLLLKEGARVMLVDNSRDNLNKAADDLKEYGDSVASVKADVSDTEQTIGYINQTVEKWEKIDVLFSNAGIHGANKPVTEFPEDVFDEVIKVNVRSSFLACKYGIPQMHDGGSIIITSSIVGVKGAPGVIAYTTSKHALVGLMRSVALEVTSRNIRVNLLCPGPVNNSFQADVETDAGRETGTDATAMFNSMIPLKRHARPEEIAGTVLFLASDQSSFSTGSIFMADGGLNA
ncbi:MAG: SDR family oxidoreductase [Spirochaetes bacterium]|nr:SDR family oxidoreductase [Spirochaetota bacterium]